MLVVTLGNAGPEGKHLSLEKVKLSLLNEEARRKDRESETNQKASVIEGDKTSLELGKVGNEVEVEGKAYLILLWESGAIPKELLTLSKGKKGSYRCGSEEESR